MQWPLAPLALILGLLDFSVVAAGDSLGYSYTTIEVPGSSGAAASAINNIGQIVGKSDLGGFLDTNGNFTTIPIPGELTSLAGINDATEIVGTSGGLGGSNPFLYVNGVFTFLRIGGQRNDAGGINNLGQIVGTSDGHGYIYTDGQIASFDVPGASQTFLYGINDSGDLVGRYSVQSSSGLLGYAFLYSHGVFTVIDVPGAQSTAPHALNNHDQIVGNFTDASGIDHSFLESNGSFTVIDFPGGIHTTAYGINDAGEIVGVYGDNNTANAFLAVPVPEPATLLLLACGCAGVGFLRVVKRQ